MKILLTGANGYIGQRLYFDLEKSFDVVGTYHHTPLSKKFIKLDVTSPKEITDCLTQQKPDFIVHVAANANPRWCEANPEAAYALNEIATKSIVAAANAIQTKVIFISSFAAITPTNVYGKTKHNSEDYVKTTKQGFIILRLSLAIGFSPNTTNDRPFNRMLKNLDENTPAIYDTSWKFQPTYVGHISEVIKSVIEQNILNETIPVAVPEVKSRFDLARDILAAFNITVTPEDKHDQSPAHVEDLTQLSQLKLPQYSYKQIINKIIDEIKHREQYIIK